MRTQDVASPSLDVYGIETRPRAYTASKISPAPDLGDASMHACLAGRAARCNEVFSLLPQDKCSFGAALMAKAGSSTHQATPSGMPFRRRSCAVGPTAPSLQYAAHSCSCTCMLDNRAVSAETGQLAFTCIYLTGLSNTAVAHIYSRPWRRHHLVRKIARADNCVANLQRYLFTCSIKHSNWKQQQRQAHLSLKRQQER